MISDERKALVEAVLESSTDDDDALWIYADYLQASGDPRGELIAMQLHALREPDADTKAELARRERQLLDDHEDHWLGPWHGKVSQWRFQRGFLDEVVVPLDTFVAIASELLKSEPLSDHLVHVRSLHLRPERFGQVYALEDAFPVALQCIRDARLRLHSLTLELELSDARAAMVAAEPWLATVESLAVVDTPVLPRGGALTTLLGSPHLGKLGALELRNTAIDDDHAERIAATPAFKRVRRLAMHSRDYRFRNTFGALGANALIAANKKLVSLELGGQHEITDDFMLNLGRRKPPLVHLGLAHAHISSSVAIDFTRLDTLETLDLRHARLDDLALPYLLRLPALHTLNIAHTPMTADAATILLRHAKPALRDVTITIPRLDPTIAEQLKLRFTLHRWR